MRQSRSALSRFSSAVVAPTTPTTKTYSLVLDDLTTRWYANKDQRFKIDGTINGITFTTGYIEIDNDSTIYSVTAMATEIQNQLISWAGYESATVSGASTEGGDKYTFTIVCNDVSASLSFNSSSRWYPTISLAEAVTQQGVATVVGVSYQGSVTALGFDDVTTDTAGNSVTLDAGGLYLSHSAASGWTAGAVNGNTVDFTKNATGYLASLSVASGAGSVATYNNGVDAVAGNAEIHTVTASPITPTGGTYVVGGNTTNYNASASVAGWTFDRALSVGFMTATTTSNTNVSDTALAPSGANLTGPEIPHSLTAS